MLIEFKVAGYRSIGAPQILSLLPDSSDKQYPENIFELGKHTALAAVALFGKNGSGKSNVIGALRLMKDIILKNFGRTSASNLPYNPFLLQEGYDEEPTTMQVVFVAGDGMRYRYGFTYNRSEIITEWLYRKALGREVYLFERQGDIIDVSSGFKGSKKIINAAIEATRNNGLFLSVCDAFNMEIAKELIGYFGKLVYRDKPGLELDNLDFKRLSAYGLGIKELIKLLDLDIVDFAVYESRIFTKHTLYDNKKAPKKDDLYWDAQLHESSGFFIILQLLLQMHTVLSDGGVLLLDDFGENLHPCLHLKLMELFHDTQYNPKKAQLIMSTNTTQVMTYGHLRRDQIYFLEKNDWESSVLYSLSDFRYPPEVQCDDNPSKRPVVPQDIEVRYLTGRYGAVPKL